MKIYQKYIDELKNHLSKLDESRFVAQQLLRFYQEAKLNSPILLQERNSYFINKIFQKMFFKKSYHHDTNSFDSFLINPDKNKYK